jgi:hypothetical protein
VCCLAYVFCDKSLVRVVGDKGKTVRNQIIVPVAGFI